MSKRGKAVHSPNLGLYLGIPPLHVPERGLIDCLNVRIKQQAIEKGTLGWGPFNDVNLDSKPVLLIELFVPRSTPSKLVLGNTTDLFVYNEGSAVVEYLTPRYQTGTVSTTNGSPTVTGSGTTWSTNLKPGDFIHVGAIDQIDPTATWYEIDSVDSDTQVTLTANYAGATASGQAYTARMTFTGDLRNPYFTEPFMNATDVDGTDGDRLYIGNSVDPIVAWDGVDDQVYYPTGLSTIDNCIAMRRFNNIMVYVGPQVSGELRRFSVRTSAIGKPEEIVTDEASEFLVHDGSDALIGAVMFGELLTLYSERHVTLMQFVGFPGVGFVFRNAVTGFGPRSARSIAQFPDYHLFVGQDTLYAFDGARALPWNTHVWREVLRRSSPQRLDLLQAHFDEEQGELMWIVPFNSDADPENGAPEKALVQHYLENVGEDIPEPHTFRELPATATGYFQQSGTLTFDQIAESWEEYNFRWNDQALQDAFPQALFGTAAGDVFILNSQDTKNGTAMTAFARFSRRPLGDKEMKGTVRRIYPFVERQVGSDATMQVRLRTSETADGPSTQRTDQEFALSIDDERHFVSPRITGRYGEVEVGSTTTGSWRVSGYDMDVEDAGKR